MSDERKESLFIIAYEGKNTADAVYKSLRDLEKQKLREIDIKTAATVHRKENGKLKLDHKRRLTVWKGLIGGYAVGLILAGPIIAAGTALAGSLIGSTRSGDRKDAKEFLEDKLGPNDSALVILVSDADWEAVDEAISPYNGTELKVELTQDAQEQIAALAEKDDVVEAMQEEIEVEEENGEAEA